MSIFIKSINEAVVQVKDKTRIDVSGIFTQGVTITDVTIKPETSESAISVYNADSSKWYLDWAYSTAGNKTITVTATDGVTPESETYNIEILSKDDDNLYSSDAELYQIESELKKYLPVGKNSYLYAHREAQQRILSYLDRKRIWNEDGSVLNKDQLNLSDVKRWSIYETLLIIYEDLVVQVGDKFKDKVLKYTELRNIERDRGAVRIDLDSNGTIDSGETLELKSFIMKRM